MAGGRWYFGLLREAGSYRIVAAGASEGRVNRALEAHSSPTMVVTLDDLPSVGLSERDWRPWLPPDQAQAQAQAEGAAGGEGSGERSGS
jgi:hypothetical protein